MTHYKINYNGNGGCHLKVVERNNLQTSLISLLNNGMKVHHVSEVKKPCDTY
jgi:hypothetical protein